MSRVDPHDLIAMAREAIEVPGNDTWRHFEPGPVMLWVHGKPVGYINAEQQAAVRELFVSNIVPPDLVAWVHGLGFPDWEVEP